MLAREAYLASTWHLAVMCLLVAQHNMVMGNPLTPPRASALNIHRSPWRMCLMPSLPMTTALLGAVCGVVFTEGVAMQLLGAKAWKNPVLALLAINTAIAMKQTDGFLSTKLVDPTYASYPGRMNTTIAGVLSSPFWLIKSC